MKLSREEIAKRAFEIFLERGAVPGKELDDWYQAESELKKKNPKKKTAQAKKSKNNSTGD